MGKHKQEKRYSMTEEKLNKGYHLVNKHPLFGEIYMHLHVRGKELLGKETAAIVNKSGDIYVNRNYDLEPEQWAYAMVHCQLHLALGHFDAECMPVPPVDKRLWNLACDIYITKFLNDMKFGKPLSAENVTDYCGTLNDEIKIYQQLMENGVCGDRQEFGTAAIHSMDMIGLEKPIMYEEGDYNGYMYEFASALAYSASEAVSVSGGHGKLDEHEETKAERAKSWFVNHYPLLGSLASVFKIVEDPQVCMREEISIAAIDVGAKEIYINPGAKLNSEEMKFVIAHELLHAGLGHQERCQGRDHHLWNVACDFVINGWLHDMQIGKMPSQGLLYDAAYKDWSAERIYDELIKELKKNQKLNTFRGYHKGDMLGDGHCGSVDISGGMTLDEFCRNALVQGLEYHISHNRGLIPAGLVEEI